MANIGEGNDNTLQYSCLGNLMDRREGQATVHKLVAQQQYFNLGNSLVVWTGKPGMLQSLGSQRVGHDLASEQQQQQQSVGCFFNLLVFTNIIVTIILVCVSWYLYARV